MSETTNLKTCPQCHQEKPADDAHFATNAKGRISWCRQCDSERASAWCRKNPERAARNRKNHMLKKRYGITLERYEEILASQSGVCKICKKPPANEGRGSMLHVDHCHATGVVRGLLCFSCNAGLGNFKDNAALLRAGAEYLEKPCLM